MKTRGFSLIEQMVVLAIIAIIATTAMPNFAETKKQLQSRSEQQRWVNFLNTARLASMQHLSAVTVCPIIENQCSLQQSSLWVAFIDNQEAGVYSASSRVVANLILQDSTHINIVPASRPYLRFGSRAHGQATGYISGIEFCPNGAVDRHAIYTTINGVGRIKLSQEKNLQGFPTRTIESKTSTLLCNTLSQQG